MTPTNPFKFTYEILEEFSILRSKDAFGELSLDSKAPM